jgi:GR25 family glycosyltransferase involved in LPS biosynthesis
MRPRGYRRKARSNTRKQRHRRRITQKGGSQNHPLIKETFLITINESDPRVKLVQAMASAARLPITLWKGVNGKQLKMEELPTLGIGKPIWKTRSRPNETHNHGTIGCFLSHRELYKFILENRKGSPDDAYLILEDDIMIPATFLDDLYIRMKDVPQNWDILYMSKMLPVGKEIAPGLLKLEPNTHCVKNIGTWAFLIRRSFLLPLFNALEKMTEELDGQTQLMFDKYNAYCFDPPFLYTQMNAPSQIQTMD